MHTLESFAEHSALACFMRWSNTIIPDLDSIGMAKFIDYWAQSEDQPQADYLYVHV